MPHHATVTTSTLEIGYLEWNAQGERTAILIHGWPDSPEGWSDVAERLAQAGYRVLCPALRGFGPTRFRYAETPRSGQLASLGRDLLAFMAALGLRHPILVGHDWGARAVANACGLDPAAGSHLIMLSVGYGTNDPQQSISLPQARNYWYHWYMATPRGALTVEQDRHAFTRMMWDSWSPAGWYQEKDFATAAAAFDNPDWASVVLHSYRHRWGFAAGDPAYGEDEARLTPAPRLAVPTLVLYGDADACNHPDSSAGKDDFFTGPYQRQLLEGVGHFPHREAPEQVAAAILAFVKR